MDFLFPATGKATIYTKSGCVFCEKAKALLAEKGLEYAQINCDEYLLKTRDAFLAFIKAISARDHRTFPIIFDQNGGFVGGFTELAAILDKKTELEFSAEF
jgi:glutaredoxin